MVPILHEQRHFSMRPTVIGSTCREPIGYWSIPKRERLNGEPYGAVAPIVKQDHALKKSTSKQRLMGLVTGPELDAHKTTVLNHPEGGYSDVPEVNIERLFSADSAAALLVDQWQLKLLRKLFIDAAIRGASVNQGLHQLSRRLCKGRREVLLPSGRIGMKKSGLKPISTPVVGPFITRASRPEMNWGGSVPGTIVASGKPQFAIGIGTPTQTAARWRNRTDAGRVRRGAPTCRIK